MSKKCKSGIMPFEQRKAIIIFACEIEEYGVREKHRKEETGLSRMRKQHKIWKDRQEILLR